jgi:hypothetical protein
MIRLALIVVCLLSSSALAARRVVASAPPPPPSPGYYPDAQPAPPAAASEEPPPRPTAVREVPGWALGGALIGFASAGIGFGVATASAATTGHLVPSLPLGALATLIFGLSVPLAAMASSSVRNGAYVSGSVGLRVAAWVLYGVTLGLAVVAVILGFSVEIPAPVIMALATSGLAAAVLMSIEALVARSQASDAVEKARRADAAVRVAPYFAVAPQPDGRAAPSIGLAGTF